MERYQVNWDDNSQVLDYVEHLWGFRDRLKGPLEAYWLDIIQTYEGLQNVDYKIIEQKLTRDYNVPKWRVRLTVNMMLPYVRTAASKHLRNRPIFDVIPATDSTKDIAVADAGKKTLQSYWFKNNVNYKFIDLMVWVALIGNGFIKTGWDPDGGHLIKLSAKDFIPEELLQSIQNDPVAIQQALQQAQAQLQQYIQINGSDTMPAGEMETSVPTPFDILAPEGYWFGMSSWVIHSQLRDISYYVERGIDPDRLSLPGTSETRYQNYKRRANSLMGYNASSGLTDSQTQILEKNLWIPKCLQAGLSEGRWVVVAGGQVINNTPNPYNHGELPFDHFFADRMPGKVWAFSGATQIHPLVKENQKAISQLIESRNLMSKPKWMVPVSANVKKTAITSEPGELIKYAGPVPPTPVVPPSPPRYVFDLYNFNQRAMDQIMAQQEATRGINPSGGRSAAVVQELQAADDGSLSLIGLGFDTGFSSVGRKQLSIAAQFYKEDRLLTYTGENGRYSSSLLKSGSLLGDTQIPGADYYNVRVTQFSQFGLTRTGQIEVLKLLLQFNVFDPSPKSRQKVLKFISMGYFEEEIDEFKIDRSNAHRENLLMSQGQPIRNAPGIEAFLPGLEDEDTVHLETHLDYMKSLEYKSLPSILQNIMQQHVQQHKLLQVMKTIEPQVILIKAQLLAANLNGIPSQLLIGAGNSNEQETSKTN